MTLEQESPGLEGVQCATGDGWRALTNSSRKDEAAAKWSCHCFSPCCCCYEAASPPRHLPAEACPVTLLARRGRAPRRLSAGHDELDQTTSPAPEEAGLAPRSPVPLRPQESVFCPREEDAQAPRRSAPLRSSTDSHSAPVSCPEASRKLPSLHAALSD